MRKQKREEEKKILQEIDQAMAENAAQEETDDEKKGIFKDKTPTTLHCKRCKTVMENGVCPTCGFRMYVSMDENKKKTIRWIVGGVCLVGFLIIFILTR